MSARSSDSQPIASAPPALSGSAAEERAVRRLPGRWLPHLLLAAVIIASASWFIWLTVARFAAFEARALDMGNLHQAIWNTAHGNWFHQTNQPGVTNRLSLHVEPILLPIAALFRLLPRVEMLLVLQAVVVALGAWPLWMLARRELSPALGERGAFWLGLAFAASWLAQPAIQAANWMEFHPVTLAPTFLITAFYFLVVRRAGWYALFAALAAACKEDLGLIVFMFGLYALLAQRRRALGMVTMALGLGWSLVAVLWIQNSFGGNIHWGRYEWLGSTPGEILRTLLTRPGLTWQHLVDTGAPRYLLQLLAPMGFLALLAPEVLLLALPSLGVNLLADFPPMHEVNTLIYAAPIAPFVALAAVMGTARLLRWMARRAGPSITVVRGAAAGAVLALVAGALWGQATGGYWPGGANAILLRPDDHDARAAAIAATIGRNEAVAAQDKLNPHTAGRLTSFIYPRVDDPPVGNADVILVDVTGPAWPQHPNDLHATVQTALAGDFGVAAADDGLLMLRRGEANRTVPASFYTPWRRAEGEWPAPAAAPPTGAAVAFGDALELLGVDVVSDERGEVVVRSQWRALRRLTEPLVVRLVYQMADGTRAFDSLFYPPVVTLWYPVTEWEPGETVLVTSLPWALETDSFSLLLGVYGGEDAEGGALPPSQVPANWLADEGRLLNMGTFVQQPMAGLQGRLTRERTWRQAESLPAEVMATFLLGGSSLLTLEAAEVGATVPLSDGVGLPVTLQWRAETAPPADFNVFLHLLDSRNERVAQWDGPMRQGAVPVATSRLLAGATVTGGYLLPVPAGLRGDFTVVTGLYDWQSGEVLSLPIGPQPIVVGRVRLP